LAVIDEFLETDSHQRLDLLPDEIGNPTLAQDARVATREEDEAGPASLN